MEERVGERRRLGPGRPVCLTPLPLKRYREDGILSPALSFKEGEGEDRQQALHKAVGVLIGPWGARFGSLSSIQEKSSAMALPWPSLVA